MPPNLRNPHTHTHTHTLTHTHTQTHNLRLSPQQSGPYLSAGPPALHYSSYIYTFSLLPTLQICDWQQQQNHATAQSFKRLHHSIVDSNTLCYEHKTITTGKPCVLVQTGFVKVRRHTARLSVLASTLDSSELTAPPLGRFTPQTYGVPYWRR